MRPPDSAGDSPAGLSLRHAAAVVCAWLLPGLGHYILGRRRHAALLAGSIGALWLGGLLIGGIGVVGHRHPIERKFNLWYLGQMLTAPSVVVDVVRDGVFKPAANPQGLIGTTAYEPSFGRVSEQGTLYTALAGMLNLLAVIDVLYRDAARPGRRPVTASAARHRTGARP